MAFPGASSPAAPAFATQVIEGSLLDATPLESGAPGVRIAGIEVRPESERGRVLAAISAEAASGAAARAEEDRRVRLLRVTGQLAEREAPPASAAGVRARLVAMAAAHGVEVVGVPPPAAGPSACRNRGRPKRG